MCDGGDEEEQRRINQIAAAKGLGRKFLSKDIFLTLLLKELSGKLAPEYVLKGGTAISRAGYTPAPRFSEDIDLDHFGASGLIDATTAIGELVSGFPAFEVDRPRHQGRCHRLDVRFTNHWGDRDRVKVELSKPDEPAHVVDIVFREHTLATDLRSQFTGGEAPSMRTYSRPFLFFMKLSALADRKEGKDVFDIWGMKNGGLRMEEVLAILNSSSPAMEDSRDIIAKAIRSLQRMSRDAQGVANSTSHYIPRPYRPEWSILLRDVGDLLSAIDDELV